MKKRILYVVIITIVAVIAAIVIMYCKYERRLKFLHDLHSNALFEIAYSHYYEWRGDFPNSMQQFIDEVKFDLGESEELIKENLCRGDPLSREDGYVMYYPLYDRFTKTRISFILLSAGIDGKLNNKLAETDTIYLDSWWSKLKVYNYDEIIIREAYYAKSSHLTSVFGSPERIQDLYPPYPQRNKSFNLADYFYGDKDYVIQVGSDLGESIYNENFKLHNRQMEVDTLLIVE